MKLIGSLMRFTLFQEEEIELIQTSKNLFYLFLLVQLIF